MTPADRYGMRMDDPRPVGDPATQAARWMVRRHRAGWTAVDEAAFAAWRDAHPAHAAAAAEAAALYALMGDALDPSEVARVLSAGPRARRRAWRLPASLATAALLAVCIGAWLLRPAAAPPADDAAAYAAQLGAARRIVLPDGSRIDLDAGSSLRWSSDGAGRHIDLERGRAVFSVTHDASRPFTVAVGVSRVRVLGTVFSVDRGGRSVTVAVDEGRVQVRHYTSASGTSPLDAVLIPGQQAVLGEQVAMGRVPPTGFASWREGRLDFQDQTLADIADILERYHPRRIACDPGIRDLRLSGTFHRGDPEAVLTAIVDLLPVRWEDRADGSVALVPRPIPAGGTSPAKSD